MPPRSALTPDVPWPGAAPYGTADRAFFHGRKRETEELLRLIQRDVLTLVIGPAGVGKTSLIQAGLLPALAESEWLPVVPKLDWSATSPKSEAPDLDPGAAVSLDNPLSRKLIEALMSASTERNFSSPEPQPGETLWEYFHRAGNRWWSSRQRVVTPIVIIDEFESMFTTATQNATAERQATGFLRELSQLAANRPPQRLATRLDKGTVSESAYDFDPVPLRIVLVMRDEFASQLTRLRSLFPTLRRSELRVEPFTTSQARDVLLRASLQVSLMSDAALDAVVARLSSDRPAASEISPAKLSSLAHELALARKLRGNNQITPELLPRQNHESAPVAEASASPVAEAEELREKLATSENRRHVSQRLGLVAALVALVAVATPVVREQFAPARSQGLDATAAASHLAPDVPSPAPAPPNTGEQTAPFESPFSIATPEFLPSAATTPAPVHTPSTPEPPAPKPPVEPVLDDSLPLPEKHPPPHPFESSAPPPEPARALATPGTSPRSSTPNAASALSPDAQRQLEAASSDRKEQQRREFLKRQQESRRTKEGASR